MAIKMKRERAVSVGKVLAFLSAAARLPCQLFSKAASCNSAAALSYSPSIEKNASKCKSARTLAIAAGLLIVPAMSLAATTVWSGVFTDQQASAGQDIYDSSCASCHGSDLHATDDEAVDLTGASFMGSWNGKKLGDLVSTIRTTMPNGNPGSLSEEQYLDIVAYILKFNNFPSGTQRLTIDSASNIDFMAQKK